MPTSRSTRIVLYVYGLLVIAFVRVASPVTANTPASSVGKAPITLGSAAPSLVVGAMITPAGSNSTINLPTYEYSPAVLTMTLGAPSKFVVKTG